jgi:hypothetical protein
VALCEGWLDWAEPEPGEDRRVCNARFPAPRHLYLWDPPTEAWTYLTSVDSPPPSRD